MDADRRHRLLGQREKTYYTQQTVVVIGSVFVVVPQTPPLTESSKGEHMVLAQAVGCTAGTDPNHREPGPLVMYSKHLSPWQQRYRPCLSCLTTNILAF